MYQWTHSNTNGIIACSALKQSYRDILTSAHKDIKQHVTFVLLHGNKDILASRMKRSDHFMPESLLESQLATLEVPNDSERCISCDITDSVDSIVEEIIANIK